MVNIKNLEKKVDDRGWLAEIIRAEDVEPKEFGQFLITTAKPGITKGGHYHKRKNEWYCVIRGKAELYLKNLTSGQEENVILDENNLQLVKIEPNVFHSIKNIGEDEMYLLAYTTEVFNSEDPDTFTLS
ncbi:MAG: WxcM-like domain-containing protein [Patescibacteria group bacterium]|jgi:UDP-2-acetamido-2,6-beta-L-arabino-hexul-4-ose reductase